MAAETKIQKSQKTGPLKGPAISNPNQKKLPSGDEGSTLRGLALSGQAADRRPAPGVDNGSEARNASEEKVGQSRTTLRHPPHHPKEFL